MLNSNVGFAKSIDGRLAIETFRGRAGHAVYGPYRAVDQGQYVAEFHLQAIELPDDDDDDVAIIDISRDSGSTACAQRIIKAGELRQGSSFFHLVFTLEDAAVLETRVAVFGNARLEVDDYVPWHDLDPGSAPSTRCAARRFPVSSNECPPLFKEAEASLRSLYQMGFCVTIQENDIVVERGGVRFLVRCWDDMNLVHEIFVEDVYRFDLERDSVVVDVGMNIGLVSLRFAAKPSVVKVFAFEPFRGTFERAISNLELNPALTTKIEATNAGISTADGMRTFNVYVNADSGSQSMRDSVGGTPVEMKMLDAAKAFEKIITDAEQAGQAVIAKIDCEGGEFDIIERLSQAKLLPRITAMMVEWHRVFKGRTQAELIAPLKAAGFLVFDRSGDHGNGFFYAVRARP